MPRGDRTEHKLTTERLTIEPFNLRDRPRQALVIDRLAYWYYHPREWLKKVALMDDVYLLNSPFTFQSMEKHAAYCAMIRCGLKVPRTVLVPFKRPPDNARWAYTAARYNRPFDLGEIAERVGYPLFMKPYDGGQWVGVTQIRNEAELHRAYDASGERLMHLQAAIDDQLVARLVAQVEGLDGQALDVDAVARAVLALDRPQPRDDGLEGGGPVVLGAQEQADVMEGVGHQQKRGRRWANWARQEGQSCGTSYPHRSSS